MKKTIITLASLSLLGSCYGQQIIGTLSAVDTSAETASFDFDGLASIDLTGMNDVATGAVGGLFFGVPAGSAPTSGGTDAFQGTFSSVVDGVELTFSDFDANGSMSWTFANTPTIVSSGISQGIFGTAMLNVSVTGNTVNLEVSGLGDGSVGGFPSNGSQGAGNGFFVVSLGDGVTSLNITEDPGGTTWRGDLYGFGVSIVPEPSSTALLGLGVFGLLARRQR